MDKDSIKALKKIAEEEAKRVTSQAEEAPELDCDWPECDHPECENPAMWIGPIGVVDDFRCYEHMSLVDLPGAYQHLKTNEYYGSKPVIFYDL